MTFRNQGAVPVMGGGPRQIGVTMNTNTQQNVMFPGNNVETLAEAEAMLDAVSTDAQKERDPEIRREMNSLKQWLEGRISDTKCRVSI